MSKDIRILDQFRLDGHTALITGGNRGLGIEMAKGLAEAGANIAILSRDAAKNEAAAALLTEAYGVKTLSLVCDVTDEHEVQQAVSATVETFGKIEILINSAGINARGNMDELSLADFERVMQVNVSGAWLASRAVTPLMKQQGYGRIIHIGSILSLIGMPGRTPYASSKGAVLMMTKAMALELAKDGITVNAILPGPFATEMNLPLTQDPVKYADFLSKLPLGRWGELHEIRGLALYLASPASSFMTGSGITIDGGWTSQ